MWNRTTTFYIIWFFCYKDCWKIYFVQKLKGLYFQKVEKGRWIASGHPTSGTGFSPNTYPTASSGSGDNWWHKNKDFIFLSQLILSLIFFLFLWRSTFLTHILFLLLKFFLNVSGKAGLLATNSLNFCLSGKIFTFGRQFHRVDNFRLVDFFFLLLTTL